MERIVNASLNSLRAFNRLLRGEAAFQQEMLVLALALPAAWFVSVSWRGYAVLVGSVLVLLMAEALNSGIEAACNAVSREFNADIQHAKDCGSLAVAIAIVLAAGVWLFAILERVM